MTADAVSLRPPERKRRVAGFDVEPGSIDVETPTGPPESVSEPAPAQKSKAQKSKSRPKRTRTGTQRKQSSKQREVDTPGSVRQQVDTTLRPVVAEALQRRKAAETPKPSNTDVLIDAYVHYIETIRSERKDVVVEADRSEFGFRPRYDKRPPGRARVVFTLNEDERRVFDDAVSELMYASRSDLFDELLTRELAGELSE